MDSARRGHLPRAVRHLNSLLQDLLQALRSRAALGSEGLEGGPGYGSLIVATSETFFRSSPAIETTTCALPTLL